MPSYLRRRGHTWFFRWKWPKRLAAFGISGELICSLKTGDYRIARRRALTLVLNIETMTSSVDLPKRAELESAVRRWIDDRVWRQEVKRAETDGIDFFDCEEIETMGREDAHQLDGLFRFASRYFAPQEKAAIARVLTGEPLSEIHRAVIKDATRQIGVAAEPNTVAGRLVERTLLRGYATLLDELRETIREIPTGPSAEKAPLRPATFIYTEHWASFVQHKQDNREWKADTASNAEGSRNIFDKLFPGVTLAQLISTPIASDFKSKLLLLPRHYARGDRKKMSSEKLIALGRTLPTPDQMQRATVNKHAGNHAEYWVYLVEQKKIPADIPNPFVGLHIPLKRGRKARNERNNWTPTLEKALFESPLYKGCASIHRRAIPGTEIFQDALFWMPLLARTMGVRENEVCDALVGGVKLQEAPEGSVWYLEIIDGKDSGSERNVPFAELVLGMGFLEQRVIGRDPSEPLFPELIPQGPGKRRSAAFTDRFAYYRKATKIYQPRTDFHSFRGNVETDLKNLASINQAWIDELIGHESTIRRSEGERYTKQIHLPILQNLVNSIGINADLSHLRYAGAAGVAAPDRDHELARFIALAEREMKKKEKPANK
ncbi:MAG: hypothetical protein QOE55_4730 [Acidobacteriaceae bacterium]|jgi:hypothetical protein|nr:hypothetical protein [Acidobacteriaceae bacterium]